MTAAHTAGPSQLVPVQFRALHTKDAAFYFTSLSNQQLHAIALSAPPSIRADIAASASKNDLLKEDFRLRDMEGKYIHENAKALDKLISTSAADIIEMSRDQPQLLKKLMNSALLADKSLSPRSVPNVPAEAGAIAISWNFDTFRKSISNTPAPAPDVSAPNVSALAPPTAVQSPSAPFLANLITFAAPQPPQNADETSSDDDDEPPLKKSKSIITPKGFTVGLADARKQGLVHYPGKGVSATSLMVEAMMGPAIYSTMTAGGTDIPTFLTQSFRHWRRTATGQPLGAETEALKIGRMIHLKILVHPTPKDALEKRPSIEIGLRRLCAILYVEESVSIGEYRDRREAWMTASQILESPPQGTVRSDDLLDIMTRKLSLQKKCITAIKAMQDNRAKQRNPQRSKTSPRNPRSQQTKTTGVRSCSSLSGSHRGQALPITMDSFVNTFP